MQKSSEQICLYLMFFGKKGDCKSVPEAAALPVKLQISEALRCQRGKSKTAWGTV